MWVIPCNLWQLCMTFPETRPVVARCGQFCQVCMDSWFDFNFFWRTLRHGLKSWFSTNFTLTMIILPWIIFCKIASDGSICSKSLSGWRKLSAMTPVKEMIQLVTVFSSTPSSEMLILEFLCSMFRPWDRFRSLVPCRPLYSVQDPIIKKDLWS